MRTLMSRISEGLGRISRKHKSQYAIISSYSAFGSMQSPRRLSRGKSNGLFVAQSMRRCFHDCKRVLAQHDSSRESVGSPAPRQRQGEALPVRTAGEISPKGSTVRRRVKKANSFTTSIGRITMEWRSRAVYSIGTTIASLSAVAHYRADFKKEQSLETFSPRPCSRCHNDRGICRTGERSGDYGQHQHGWRFSTDDRCGQYSKSESRKSN
jgi:hypothetical protein